MSCEADIPPQWVNAIQSNQCPGCGGEIMNEAAKGLLDELTEAMKKMPNNPQGVAGWLLSNYRFAKIGEAIPTERFHDGSHKPQQAQGGSMPAGLKVADNPAQAFLARTGQYRNIQQTNAKLSQSNQLARMAQQIATLPDEDMYGDENVGVESPGGESYFDEDEGVMIERGPKMSRALVTGTDLVDATAPALSPDEIQALANSVDSEQADDATTQQVLQLQRKKRLLAQQGVASGGGQGLFRRSS